MLFYQWKQDIIYLPTVLKCDWYLNQIKSFALFNAEDCNN